MKTFSIKVDPLTNEEYWEVSLRGQQLLSDPAAEQGLGLLAGRTPRRSTSTACCARASRPSTTQVDRTMEAYHRKPDDLEKYIYLQGLMDRNEVLFYRTLVNHLTEMVPIVYTPTVGQACQQLSKITRRYRGVYISPDTIGRIDQILQSVSLPSVNLMVVTDGERILGLGDLGSDGMGIPVGKVKLYVAAGGLHPACCLPVCLDVGTNNQALLDDPLYLGWRHPRLEGDEYWAFIEKFVLGVKRNFPEALVQWEDFAKHKAFTLLERYRERVLSFDDDIQGTGAVALVRDDDRDAHQEEPVHRPAFRRRRARPGRRRHRDEHPDDAQGAKGCRTPRPAQRIFAVDMPGLLFDRHAGPVEVAAAVRAGPRAPSRAGASTTRTGSRSLDVVRNAKPTVLIGVTAQTGLFGGDILKTVASYEPQPIILALSNPDEQVGVHAGRDGRGHRRPRHDRHRQPVRRRRGRTTGVWSRRSATTSTSSPASASAPSSPRRRR